MCLKKQAHSWYELNDFMDIDDAICEFKRKYWGDDGQARFREKMYTAKYNPNFNIRMADYAMEMAKQARLVEPPMSDAEIVRCLKRHFQTDVAREIRPTAVSSVADLVSLLDELDEERRYAAERQKRASVMNAKPSTFANTSDNRKWKNKESARYKNQTGSESSSKQKLKAIENTKEPIVEFPQSEEKAEETKNAEINERG